MKKDNMPYTEKTSNYFSTIRDELIQEIPIGSGSVLEIGCGQGETGAMLKKEGRARWIACVELSEQAAQRARERLDFVISGNIEHLELPFKAGQFDVLLLGDVLEHLIDPWGQLKRLMNYLAADGTVVASIPNVRNWRVLFPLLFLGKWEYGADGILDRTHLRFFTRNSIVTMFNANGLRITKMVPLGKRSSRISRFLCGSISEIITPQYLVVAERSISVAL